MTLPLVNRRLCLPPNPDKTRSMSPPIDPRPADPSGPPPRLMVVMGVSGCGKSTIGAGLAAALGGVFLDADAFHPAANVAKMSRGEPLSDADRWPWLDALARAMAAETGIVVAGCSALRRRYRDRLTTAAGEPVLFLHLAGSRALIEARMAARRDHFMPLSLLDSQFATLEPLQADETGLTVDITPPAETVVARLASQLA
jgi:gluconokinase